MCLLAFNRCCAVIFFSPCLDYAQSRIFLTNLAWQIEVAPVRWLTRMAGVIDGS